MDEELRQRLESIDQSLRWLKDYLLEFRSEIIRQFEDVGTRLDTLSGAVASMDARLPVMTKSLSRLEARVYGPPSQDAKLAELEARIRRLEGAA